MERYNPENETIVLLNDGDRAEGFFQFGTSKALHYQKLLKRIGGEAELISLKVDVNADGSPRWWQCKVPVKFLSAVHFGLKLGDMSKKREFTEEHRAKLRAAREKNRT